VVGGFVALLIVMYSVASYASLRKALLGGALVLLGVFTYPLVNDLTFADEVGNLAIFIGAWALGRSVRSRQLRAVEAENRVVAVERDREQRLRAVIADERGRISRELHDVVAHGVSVMVLQAGAARQTLDRDTGKVRQLLLTIEQMGRQSLDEMHRLLGILRRADDDLTLAPPLTLGSIPGLLDDVQQTGLAVRYRIEGDQRPLPPGLEVSAYRIVQEALTNTIKHADAGHAEVVLRYGADDLELTITDDGRGADRGPGPGRHGLIGMRERAQLFGGSVTAGAAEPKGWRVRAILPIGGSP
jgi:signal transduction histidine kinase